MIFAFLVNYLNGYILTEFLLSDMESCHWTFREVSFIVPLALPTDGLDRTSPSCQTGDVREAGVPGNIDYWESEPDIIPPGTKKRYKENG